MLALYFKFAARIFQKDKFFSVLNILGLALGISVGILLLLILKNDLTYDQYHVNRDQIYRLGTQLNGPGIGYKSALTARELGPILKEELPEVQSIVRIEKWNHTLVKYQGKNGDEKKFYEDAILNADSNYFNLFTHEFIFGSSATSLSTKNSVVLTESIGQKYFGATDPINKELQIKDKQWIVTGIIRDVPSNTHLKFDIMVSNLEERDWVVENKSKGESISEAFWNPDLYTYLLLPANYDPEVFDQKFEPIYTNYIKPFGEQIDGKYKPILEPFTSIHFNSEVIEDEPRGSLAYLYAFTSVGIFIILLAGINYVNLSTAKSINRAMEISVKKILGSEKRMLIASLLGESLLLSFFALLAAVAFVLFVLNATSFNQLIGKSIQLDFFDPIVFLGSIGMTVVIGLMAGLYPALYLTSIPVILGLRGKGAFANDRSNRYLRNGLITLQFCLSIFVIACTLLMNDQIEFLRNQDLGFNKENVLVISIRDTGVEKQMEAFKNDLLKQASVSSVTTTYDVMGKDAGGRGVMMAEGETGMQQQSFTILTAGDDYLETLGIKLLSGKDFKKGTATSGEGDREFIINETAAKIMGWKDPIGKKLTFFHSDEDSRVIGLVKDFNSNSLHNPITPVVIAKSWDDGGNILLRTSGDLRRIIGYANKLWGLYAPERPFEYYFLDQHFNEQYKEDEAQSTLLGILSYICLFISFLGLLGLSAFAAAQRTKEIGIRKVLGATVPAIIFLLYRRIMITVLLGTILAMPLVFFLMNKWLENFAYKTTLNYKLFIPLVGAALASTFLIVLLQSIKSARTNPVDSIKYE